MALLKRSRAVFEQQHDESSYPYPSHMPGSLACTTAPVAKMLRMWNYKEGSGLGARGQGIVVPVQASEHCSNAGIGHRDKPRDNGLQGAPPWPVKDEWLERGAVPVALRRERECYDKTLTLLRDMQLRQADDSAETAEALAAIVESEKVLRRKRAPGAWKASLPPSAVRYVVERVLTPRIAVEAREWEPGWNPGCDHWLRPWIPLIGHLPESVYATVEGKISGGGRDTMSLWKDYLDPAHWEIFSRRHILPKLTRWMRRLRITPPKQIDVSFRTVMSWAPLVRTEDVISILAETKFFDRWESALRQWLQSAKPSLGEAVEWCTGWKKLFSPELLVDERVRARLEVGAAMVDRETQELNSLVLS